jgi:hypothetical protein
MNPADEEAAKIEPTEGQSSGAVAGSNDQIEEQLGATLKELQRNQSKLAEDLQSHFLRISHHLDYETSERKAIHDRLRAIDNQTKRTLRARQKGEAHEGSFVTLSRFVLVLQQPWLGNLTAKQRNR